VFKQKKFGVITIFSLAFSFWLLIESALLAQRQLYQDFKVNYNFVGIGENMGPRVTVCNSGMRVIVWIENYNELYYHLMNENNNHIGISVPIITSLISGGYSIDFGMNEIGNFSVILANQQTSDVYLMILIKIRFIPFAMNLSKCRWRSTRWIMSREVSNSSAMTNHDRK
jgi:hypothetical protein